MTKSHFKKDMLTKYTYQKYKILVSTAFLRRDGFRSE